MFIVSYRISLRLIVKLSLISTKFYSGIASIKNFALSLSDKPYNTETLTSSKRALANSQSFDFLLSYCLRDKENILKSIL